MSIGPVGLPLARDAVSSGSSGTDSPERSPIERALDLGVYAPLGFALEFRRLVPELAEAGRQQVAFSRSLGKAALSTLSKASAARSASPASSGPPAAPAAAKASSGVIDGYDGLTAREVIALSRAATPAQLAWMLEHEREGKKRKTVLNALGAT